MASVIFDRVTKCIGDVTVVDEFSLEVQDKEFVVLVGPSGCGQTTLLRMVAGLDAVSSGRITIGDTEQTGRSPKACNVAVVSRGYALYPRMTVYQNIASSLIAHRLPQAEIDQRVLDVAATLGIEDALGLKPKEITAGQRQRVALARAAILEPKVVLMDQPLANFDGRFKSQMRTELAKLHQKLQTTVIYATRDENEAMTLGDRIVVMRDGQIHQVATPRGIYNRPADLFVAGFIGTPAMNFILAKLVQEEGSLVLTHQGAFRMTVPLSKASQLQSYIGREVVLGIRPEHVADSAFDYAKKDWVLNAKVELVEPLGVETILYVHAGMVAITARVHPDSRATVGETVELALNMEKAHIFDKQTEKRIV